MTSIKNIIVDFDSLEDCQKLFNQMKSVIGQLKLSQSGFVSKNARNELVFNICMDIYNKDISKIYDDMSLDVECKYYVYAHCDPGFKIAIKKEGKSTFAASLGMTCMPFYIGKGLGNRAFELDRNDSHRKIRQKIKTFNNDITVQILADDLTEKEALMRESKLIDIFGLKSFGGRLVNLDEGHNNAERRKIYAKELRELNTFYKNSV